MCRWLFAIPVLATVSGTSALAACPTFPYSFSNGSTADANQVNSDFQNVITCFAPITSPVFSGNAGFGVGSGGWSGNAVVSANYPFNNGWAGSFYYANSSPVGGGALLIRTDTTGAVLAGLYYQSTNVGSISTNSTSTSFNTTSDYRLKTNVEPVTGSLELLMRLKPDSFNWKTAPAEPKVIGFLADELQAVVPFAVTGEKDAVNKDGSIKPQMVDYSKLVPLLVGAIKDQQGEIDKLNAAVTALKSQK